MMCARCARYCRRKHIVFVYAFSEKNNKDQLDEGSLHLDRIFLMHETKNLRMDQVTFLEGSLPKIMQKQPSRDVLRKRCSENMQQIYRRTPMPKCYFNNIALQLC